MTHLLGIRLFLFLGVFALVAGKNSQHEGPPAPKPFWRFNQLHSLASSHPALAAAFPAWPQIRAGRHHYPSQADYGTRHRDSPREAWQGGPNSSPFVVAPRGAAGRSGRVLLGQDDVLVLGSRPRMFHGPRRRRDTPGDRIKKIKDLKTKLADVPLFCWKILVNCRRFRDHVCCPVMPAILRPKKDRAKGKKKKDREEDRVTTRDKREVEYVYPAGTLLMDLLAAADRRRDDSTMSGWPEKTSSPHRQQTHRDGQRLRQEQLDREIHQHRRLREEEHRRRAEVARRGGPQIQKRLSPHRPWKPLNCPVDCGLQPRHGCCLREQVDRFLPVGPYVQPTLLENWVSAAFELFGNNPLTYLAAKKLFLLAAFAVGVAAWGWLGQAAGMVPQFEDAERRAEDRLDMTSRVVLPATEGPAWIGRLSERIKSRGSAAASRFLCCLVSDGENAVDVGGRSSDHLECYAFRRQAGRRGGPLGKLVSALDCMSGVAYDVTIGEDDGSGEEKLEPGAEGDEQIEGDTVSN